MYVMLHDEIYEKSRKGAKKLIFISSRLARITSPDSPFPLKLQAVHDGRNLLLEGPKVERVVRRDRHHGALVHQKLDLDDGTGRLALVTDVRIDARLAQSTIREVKNYFP